MNAESQGYVHDTVFYPYLIYKIIQIDATPSIFIRIDNGLTYLNLPLNKFLNLVSPVVDRVWRKLSEPESQLVSTISEPKNEQLLLFRS